MGDMAAKRRRSLATMSDEQLLAMRMCDLGLKVEGTALEDRVGQLYGELEARDIRRRPHVGLSDEWFSPDGVPGIALPFYLADARLMRLEKTMMMHVDGGTRRTCTRILRHEAGHAVCAAYRLHYRKRWREIFGRHSEPYPDYYQPRPNSRRFVLHLDWWYAQAHPTEDFAERFAVWLNPQSGGRQQYHGWPAMRKLDYVNETMKDIAGMTPPVRTRRRVDPISEIRATLGEHYKRKRGIYATDWPDFYDRDLRKIFSGDAKHARHEAASAFLRRSRPIIRERVANWTGEHPYTIDQVLRDMVDRCRELKLRLAQSERETLMEVNLMVTVQTMNYLHGGRHRIAL